MKVHRFHKDKIIQAWDPKIVNHCKPLRLFIRQASFLTLSILFTLTRFQQTTFISRG